MPARWGLALAVLLAPSPASARQDPVRIQTLLAAEDARPAALAGLAPLLDALASAEDSLLVRLAVRGLGRQERSDLLDALRPALSSTWPSVRLEAANAVAQAAQQDRSDDARRWLEDRVALEPEPAVLGVILRSLGRLPAGTPAVRRQTETLLIRATRTGNRDAAPPVLEGAAHGLFSLYRAAPASEPPSPEAIERLVELLEPTRPPLVRRLAIAALVAGRHADSGLLLDALRDPEREVRRQAAVAALTQAELAGRERIIRRAWGDSDPAVRHEALRAFARHLAGRDGCTTILAALDDPDVQVRLLAVDLLGGCGPAAAPRLAALAEGPVTPAAWHSPARALVALARTAPARADSLVPRFMQARTWWARVYAARAAQATGNVAQLARLARDPHPNVRHEAITALRLLAGHAMDSLYLAALESSDYQLLLAAARALDSAPQPAAVVPPLLRALARVSAERRETSRDVREAMLTTLGTLGGPAQVPSLRRYLADFDPRIADLAAALLSRWTGREVRAEPRPLPRAPVPRWQDLDRWARTTATLVMADGQRVVLRLRPFEAPTNVARFLQMARDGRFDGLTFHRVVPGFVVQGGSPGANEYQGQGPFTRDELGLDSHHRGTVGISTRGRDTGDGQIFINLVDNWRLDHHYTIIAEVLDGLPAVDRLLEGAVIARVELKEP